MKCHDWSWRACGHFYVSNIVRGQKLEKILSDHEAQFISWCICAPLVVKLLIRLTGQEKNITKLNDLFYFYILFAPLLPPKQWNDTPCVLTPSHTLSSPIYSPPCLHVFGWLLCALSSIGIHLRTGVFSFFCINQFNNWSKRIHPPICSNPVAKDTKSVLW